MPSPLDLLRVRLEHCATREVAGQAWLGTVLAEAGAALPDDARALRAVLHIRRGASYSGVVVVSRVAGDDPRSLTASSTAWRQVEALGRPVVLDVAAPRPTASPETVAMLVGRQATHVLAFGLLEGPEGERAMVSVEVACPAWAGMGSAPWRPLLEALESLVAVGGGWVLERPPATVDGALLPVLGVATRPLPDLLARFARYDDTVLLLGETGTGKTRAARWLHDHSAREPGPFQAVQIHTIPEGLVEGELFGWRRGAHAQAVRDRTGIVPRAHGGTLFIDEVHRLPLAVQDKLLRLIDERTYRVLGDDGGDRTVDVRFVVAASVDLEAETRAGRFLPDLYYRLSALPVRFPPLRERLDELAGWVDVFSRRWLRESGRGGAVELTGDGLTRLESHGWPGNLRELDRVVRRALVESDPDADGVWRLRGRSFRGLATGESPAGAAAPGASALQTALDRAAEAWVEARLDAPDAVAAVGDFAPERLFRAAVYAHMSARLDAREAAIALGLEKQVEQRNHARALRRELERWAAFTGRPLVNQ